MSKELGCPPALALECVESYCRSNDRMTMHGTGQFFVMFLTIATTCIYKYNGSIIIISGRINVFNK